MPSDAWDTRRILSSQALVADDGTAALGLELDDGRRIAGELDLRTIADIRAQLDRCEAALRSPTSPAQ